MRLGTTAVAIAAALLFSVLAATARSSPEHDGAAPASAKPNSKPKSVKAIVDHVADGDTIKVVLGDGHEEYVRFIGIDTPEVYGTPECGGTEASESMNKLLKPGDRVKLVRDRSQGNKDTYDRLLRYVVFAGRDLGQLQIKRGWARVYVYDRPFDRLSAYDRAEASAQRGDRGVWGLCGAFES